MNDAKQALQEEMPAIDVPSETQAMTVRQAVAAVEQVKPQVTAAQAKIEAVANLTAAAYAKASELRLTPKEIAKLQADFPDEAFKPGAAGKEQLIYIEHAFLRDRLNQVIGPGQWALIPRSRWAEDYQTFKGTQASRVYVEAMLMVRGCFVAESVGEMSYFPKNESQNYGDAVEGAKTAAFRRCCKEFGIGLQAWKKDWCQGWWDRRNSKPPQTTAQMRQKPPSPPAETMVKKSAAPLETFIPVCTVKMVHTKQGNKKDGTPWTAWFVLLNDGISDLEAATFSKTLGTMAEELAKLEPAAQCEATIKPGSKPGSFELVRMMPKDQPPTDLIP